MAPFERSDAVGASTPVKPGFRMTCLNRLAVGFALVVASGVPSSWQQTSTDVRVQLRNIAAQAGVRFVHQHSPTPAQVLRRKCARRACRLRLQRRRPPRHLLHERRARRRRSRRAPPAYANRLYRNDGDMRFTDVTDAAGVRGVGYAMGAAAADYDNDGDVDLFVAGVRQNQLLRNRGDGRFEDETKRAGIASGDWAVAAAGSTTTTTAASISSSCSTCSGRPRHESLLRRSGARYPDLLPSTRLRGPAEPPVSEPRRRDVRGRLGARGSRCRMSGRA